MNNIKIKNQIKIKLKVLYKFYAKFKILNSCKKLLKDKKYVKLRNEACTVNKNLNLITTFIDQYSALSNNRYSFCDAIINDRLVSITTNWINCEMDSPIFICAVKNDLQRVRIQVSHLRKLGVDHIVYIDNGSTDGTFEWLSEQKEVNLYKTYANFNADRKSAWYRKIADIYGYGRWYLICDSDELFEYPKCEEQNIRKFIKFLEKNKIYSLRAIMLDMYTDNQITNNEHLTDREILEKFCWIDTESFFYTKTILTDYICGGPRKRVFSIEPVLIKYPLIKLQPDVCYMTHEFYGKSIKVDNKLHAVLKHYKFLPEDNERYEIIAQNGNYAGGSAEYKAYLKILKENPHTTFYYDGSLKYTDSSIMYKINIFDKKFYDNWD